MYPHAELRRLAGHKAALERRIVLRRARCVGAARRVMQPLVWLDRMLAAWRQLAPFVVAPLGLLLGRTLFRRSGVMGSALRWSPVVFGLVRRFRARSL